MNVRLNDERSRPNPSASFLAPSQAGIHVLYRKRHVGLQENLFSHLLNQRKLSWYMQR